MHSGAKILLFLALSASSALARGPIPECLRYYAELSPETPEAIARQRIREGEFTVTRDLKKYIEIFGDKFARGLRELGPRGRWLNGGGGRALAEKEYLASPGRGKVVSLVYERPHDLAEHELPRRSDRFHYLEGRLLEDVPDAELGTFKIISDLFGPLAYTRDFSGVLQKYLNLLEDDGTLFFTLELSISNTQMVARNGEAIPLKDWIKSIPGLEVYTARVGDDESYQIRKLVRDVRVPPLENVHYSYTQPPIRYFNADVLPKAGAGQMHGNGQSMFDLLRALLQPAQRQAAAPFADAIPHPGATLAKMYVEMAARGALLNQMDVQLGERGLIVPNGGLCASTCVANTIGAGIASVLDKPELTANWREAGPEAVDGLVNLYRKHGDARYGAHSDTLVEEAKPAFERMGLRPQYRQPASEEQLERLFRGDALAIGTARLTHEGQPIVGPHSTHAIEVLNIKPREKLIYVSDPNWPNQIYAAAYNLDGYGKIKFRSPGDYGGRPTDITLLSVDTLEKIGPVDLAGLEQTLAQGPVDLNAKHWLSHHHYKVPEALAGKFYRLRMGDDWDQKARGMAFDRLIGALEARGGAAGLTEEIEAFRDEAQLTVEEYALLTGGHFRAPRAADPAWLGHVGFEIPSELKNRFYELRTSSETDPRHRGVAFERLIEQLEPLRNPGAPVPEKRLHELRDQAGLTSAEYQELLRNAMARRR